MFHRHEIGCIFSLAALASKLKKKLKKNVDG